MDLGHHVAGAARRDGLHSQIVVWNDNPVGGTTCIYLPFCFLIMAPYSVTYISPLQPSIRKASTIRCHRPWSSHSRYRL